ncbi:MAG: prepilin-type N-terminal cleavage/methylation domain-containing protein [Epsilonproteobacteria bacterium]|nr:prepilin-type N-terminal cleavage/methylation domain-containing protein [Campylobacterota bacterium]
MNKKGFTLIEVMVAVMIITVVIAALIKTNSETSFLFGKLKDDQKMQKYLTLVLHSDYGLENKRFSLDRTVDRFDIDDDLRRKLKKIYVEVKYQKTRTIDFSEDKNSSSGTTLEVGKTVLSFPKGNYSYVRITNR